MLELSAYWKKLVDKKLNEISNGLKDYQVRNHRTNEEMARMLSLSVPNYKAILENKNIRRSAEEFIWMLYVSGVWR